MTAEIRPARPEDRESAVELLHTHMSAKIPRERWALLFDYSWRPSDAPDCGRILEEGGRMVGYLGATYVDREIGGRSVRICNMSSWYLLRPYRGQGYGRAMALDLTSDPDVTYTDLTATPQVHAMLLAHAGFEILDEARWILRRPPRGAPAIELTELTSPAPPLGHHLGFKDLRMFRAEGPGGSCAFALQVKKKGEGIAYHQLLHARPPDYVARHAAGIAAALLKDEVSVLAIDRRFAPEAPDGAEIEPIAQPRLYKSRRLRPEQIDNLYNEVLLLDQKLP
jgi:GNAT superfamily N-acetyltransferase